VTQASDSERFASRSYGSPTVTLPLPGPGQAGAIPDPNWLATVQSTDEQDGEWFHSAELFAGEIFEGQIDPDNDDPVLAWQLYMYKDATESGKPTLSARDYVRFLGRGPTQFIYGFNTPSDQGAYTGTATLLTELQPVPEPTSLLLVASGLGALGARKWRRKRAATS